MRGQRGEFGMLPGVYVASKEVISGCLREWKSVSSDIHSTNFLVVNTISLLSFDSVFMGNL